jgi:uncharacterized protein YndB with AHSA1/START domain
MKPDPKLDLTLTRVVSVSTKQLWAAWTTPKHLMKWFCPVPWQTTECVIDLRPGGRFYTMMKGPAGEQHVNEGCYLDIVKQKRLVWTDTLVEGYRPSATPFLMFTAHILMEPHRKGAKYSALVMHRDPTGRKQHEDMGFHDGWGKATDQLVKFAGTV